MTTAIALVLFVAAAQADGGTAADVPSYQLYPAEPPQQQTPPMVAEAPRVRRSRVSVGPVLFLFGGLGLEYERGFNPDFSVVGGLQLMYPAIGALLGIYNAGATGTFGLRFFPLQAPAPDGLWLGTEINGSAAWVVFPGASGLSTGINGVFTLGYTFISQGGVTFSGGGGLGLSYTFRNPTNAPSLFGNGLGPAITLHLNVGYAF